MTPFVLEDYMSPPRHVVDRRPVIGRIGCPCQSWPYRSGVLDSNLLHLLHGLHFPLDFAVECDRKQGGELIALSAADFKRTLDV